MTEYIQLKIFEDESDDLISKKPRKKPKWKDRKSTTGTIRTDLLNKLDLTENGNPYVKAYKGPIPNLLLPFSVAKSTLAHNCWIHFFLDDVSFERIWKQHYFDLYSDILKRFNGIFAPDFSVRLDMPTPLKIYNAYRIKAITQLFQKQGICVIPVIPWAEPQSYDYCFDGYEEGGVVAISTNGIKKHPIALKMFYMGLHEMIKRLKPQTIIIMGDKVDIDTDIPIVWFDNENIKRLRQIG